MAFRVRLEEAGLEIKTGLGMREWTAHAPAVSLPLQTHFIAGGGGGERERGSRIDSLKVQCFHKTVWRVETSRSFSSLGPSVMYIGVPRKNVPTRQFWTFVIASLPLSSILSTIISFMDARRRIRMSWSSQPTSGPRVGTISGFPDLSGANSPTHFCCLRKRKYDGHKSCFIKVPSCINERHFFFFLKKGKVPKMSRNKVRELNGSQERGGEGIMEFG